MHPFLHSLSAILCAAFIGIATTGLSMAADNNADQAP